jgi:GNAT superfamily N-acetyltransferase
MPQSTIEVRPVEASEGPLLRELRLRALRDAPRWFDQPAGVAHLWGMWVEPAARGRGLGRTLVLGFRRTGETKPLPPDGIVRAFFLARSL